MQDVYGVPLFRHADMIRKGIGVVEKDTDVIIGIPKLLKVNVKLVSRLVACYQLLWLEVNAKGSGLQSGSDRCKEYHPELLSDYTIPNPTGLGAARIRCREAFGAFQRARCSWAVPWYQHC